MTRSHAVRSAPAVMGSWRSCSRAPRRVTAPWLPIAKQHARAMTRMVESITFTHG